MASQTLSVKHGHYDSDRRVNSGATKRFFKIVLISSLYFKFRKCTNPSIKELEALNTSYNLVTRTDSLMIPACLSGWLWKGLNTRTLLEAVRKGTVTIQDAVSFIEAFVPRIGRYPGMTHDISRILNDSLTVREV